MSATFSNVNRVSVRANPDGLIAASWPHADSQVTSTVLRGDDLKSKLRSLPAQPRLRTPDGVVFRLVKDALVVGLLCAQQVVNDAGQFVGGCCDCLGSAKLARDAPEKFSEIIFSVMQ
jgi:hypothetical protein